MNRRHLEIRSVAEAVQTAGEWDWVRRRGADDVQGFLFARPARPPPSPRFVDHRPTP